MEIHAIIWLIRIFGSFLDGFNGRTVGWLAFHVPNWFRRDVPIALLYWLAIGPIWNHPFDWGVAALGHFMAHHVFYQLGELVRRKGKTA